MPLGQGPETTVDGRSHQARESRHAESLERGEDGLFRMQDGSDAPADASVRVASGVLESSNVNVADAMVNMIELSRHFDLQVQGHADRRRQRRRVGAAAAILARSIEEDYQ